MFPKWLWQNLISNWIWYLLAILAPVAIGWLTTEGPKWVVPALCALGAFVLILVAFASIKGAQAAFTVRAYLEQQARIGVTVDNVEGLVREWSDTFRFSVKKLGAKDAYHWAFELKGPAEMPITVMRDKDLSHYLTVIGSLTVIREHSKLFKTLKKSDADALIAQLRIEMNRLNIGYTGFANPPERFFFVRRIPISPDLTDYRFVTTVNEVTSAVLLVRQIFFTALHSGALLAEGKTPIAPISESAAATATTGTK